MREMEKREKNEAQIGSEGIKDETIEGQIILSTI